MGLVHFPRDLIEILRKGALYYCWQLIVGLPNFSPSTFGHIKNPHVPNPLCDCMSFIFSLILSLTASLTLCLSSPSLLAVLSADDRKKRSYTADYKLFDLQDYYLSPIWYPSWSCSSKSQNCCLDQSCQSCLQLDLLGTWETLFAS